MAQGKLKVKTKLPTSVKTKANKPKKSPATKRRGNAPVQPKKAKFQESQKLKKMITKTVNIAAEDELRERALEGKKTLTKKDSSNPQKLKKMITVNTGAKDELRERALEGRKTRTKRDSSNPKKK